MAEIHIISGLCFANKKLEEIGGKMGIFLRLNLNAKCLNRHQSSTFTEDWLKKAWQKTICFIFQNKRNI